MKSYWIAAAVFLVTAWPGSKACAVGAQQTSADSKPVQHVQVSPSSASLKNPVEAPVRAAPAAASAGATTPVAAPVKPKNLLHACRVEQGSQGQQAQGRR